MAIYQPVHIVPDLRSGLGLGVVDVIGHITDEQSGCALVTPDGQTMRLRAQGFPEHQ